MPQRVSEPSTLNPCPRLNLQLVFRLTPGQIPLKTKTILTHGPEQGVLVTVHKRE
jgi:hypothetical protein